MNAKYLLSLEPDRFLSGVRQNAGLQPKAPRYGGWESQGKSQVTIRFQAHPRNFAGGVFGLRILKP